MTRTFHSRINRITLVCCLLPSTAMALCFFWYRMPIAALCFVLLMVVLIERLIHTTYTFTPDGRLEISHGRFSTRRSFALSEITQAEPLPHNRLMWLKSRDTVLLHFCNGKMMVITPFTAEEFCKHFNKKRP